MLDIQSPSIWEDQYYYSNVDCLVVGGGITGLNTALNLKKNDPNKKILLIESLGTGNVASTRNAGFACFGSVGELLDDLDQLKEEDVAKLLSYRFKGLTLLKETVGERNMNYKACGGYELFRKGSLSFEHCAAAIPRINKLIEQSLLLKETFSIKRHSVNSNAILETSIYNQYEGALNPVLMMRELEKLALEAGVRILKGVSVKEILKANHHVLLSNEIQLQYKQIAICTNGLAKELIRELEVEIAPNLVGHASCRSDFEWNSCFHMDGGYIYFRRVDQSNILIGGGRNILTTDYRRDLSDDERIKQYLRETLNELTQDTIEFNGFWKGYLGIGPDRFPIIKSLGDDVFCGVRLGGMGVAIGSYLGKELAELMSNA